MAITPKRKVSNLSMLSALEAYFTIPLRISQNYAALLVLGKIKPNSFGRFYEEPSNLKSLIGCKNKNGRELAELFVTICRDRPDFLSFLTHQEKEEIENLLSSSS